MGKDIKTVKWEADLIGSDQLEEYTANGWEPCGMTAPSCILVKRPVGMVQLHENGEMEKPQFFTLKNDRPKRVAIETDFDYSPDIEL